MKMPVGFQQCEYVVVRTLRTACSPSTQLNFPDQKVRMICGALVWISLAGCALGFLDSSELADQLLEFAKPIIKTNGDDSVSIPGFQTNITDIFGYNMGTLVCDKGTLTDLSSIQRAGPAIMSKIVIRDDIVLSMHMSTKLALMKLEFNSCDVTILDYPVKNVKPQMTVGTNGLAVVVTISGKGDDCASKVQKSIVNIFSDVTVVTGTDAPLVDGFLSGLIQGNQAEITNSIQKAIYGSLGKALNDAKICNFFNAYLG